MTLVFCCKQWHDRKVETSLGLGKLARRPQASVALQNLALSYPIGLNTYKVVQHNIPTATLPQPPPHSNPTTLHRLDGNKSTKSLL